MRLPCFKKEPRLRPLLLKGHHHVNLSTHAENSCIELGARTLEHLGAPKHRGKGLVLRSGSIGLCVHLISTPVMKPQAERKLPHVFEQRRQVFLVLVPRVQVGTAICDCYEGRRGWKAEKNTSHRFWNLAADPLDKCRSGRSISTMVRG